jgi:hypothetical protein
MLIDVLDKKSIIPYIHLTVTTIDPNVIISGLTNIQLILAHNLTHILPYKKFIIPLTSIIPTVHNKLTKIYFILIIKL